MSLNDSAIQDRDDSATVRHQNAISRIKEKQKEERDKNSIVKRATKSLRAKLEKM